MKEERFLNIANVWVRKNFKSQKAASEEIGISQQDLSWQLSGTRPPSEALIKALGL